MARQKKTWILVKGREYSPNGVIALGQIFAKPFEPSIPLLEDGPLSFADDRIDRTHQEQVDTSLHSSLGFSFKAWAELDLIPIKGSLGANHKNSHSEEWTFERIDNATIVPKTAEVKAAIATEAVAAQIRRSKFDFKKRLYMVTGVRIVHGAKLKEKDSTSVGGSAKISVDLAAFTPAPVTLGPKGKVQHETENSLAFKKSSDFVYAYRLCQIHYGKDVYIEPVNDGDTFRHRENSDGDTDQDSEEEEEEDGEARLVVEKVASTDYDGGKVPHKTFTLAPTADDEEEEVFIMAE